MGDLTEPVDNRQVGAWSKEARLDAAINGFGRPGDGSAIAQRILLVHILGVVHASERES